MTAAAPDTVSVPREQWRLYTRIVRAACLVWDARTTGEIDRAYSRLESALEDLRANGGGGDERGSD